jgi:hypothetical protein
MAQVSLLFGLATEQLSTAQASRPQPADIRIDHDELVEDLRLDFIFSGVLQGTGLHGGFVEMTGCSGDLPKGRLQIKQGATVRQAMDALVAAKPTYRWELKDGVVNLMPRGGASLLDTRIARFQMDATGLAVGAVLQDLLALPEVRERQAALGLKSGTHAGPGGGGGGLEINPVPRQPVPVHVNLQNLSLQEAFNKVVESSPDGGWIIARPTATERRHSSSKCGQVTSHGRVPHRCSCSFSPNHKSGCPILYASFA